MAKTNKKTQVKPNRARSERPDPQRLAKLFNLKRPGGNPSPTNPPFSKTNQPKGKRGRPPGLENLFTREIKTAAVTAAKMYGVDGTGLGGLIGFFFFACDKQTGAMLSLLGRICPMQKDDADKPPEREEQVYRTPAEFDAALKARGLPTLSSVLALQYDHSSDPDLAKTIAELKAGRG